MRVKLCSAQVSIDEKRLESRLLGLNRPTLDLKSCLTAAVNVHVF